MLSKIKRALKNIHLHGEKDSKSKSRQLREIFLLALKYRFSPLEYEAYGFFLKEKDWPVMLTYMSNYEVTVKLRRNLYDKQYLVILNNKMLFNRFYSSFNLPMPKMYGFFNPESGFLADGTPFTGKEDFLRWFSETKTKDLFIKPAGGLQGFNVMVIKDMGKEGFWALEGNNCRRWTAKDLYHHITGSSTTGNFFFPGYILEELIVQHPALSRINPSSVNTCRILTLKNRNNSIDTPLAFIRFGRAGKLIDNMHQGGIAAGIDVERGVLRQGTYSPKWGSGWISHHPDSGASIEGFRIPHWEAARELAMSAAAVTPGIKTIGWDIAIGEKGPILVEGNSSWNPITMQQTARGLLTPGYRKVFEEYGLSFR